MPATSAGVRSRTWLANSWAENERASGLPTNRMPSTIICGVIGSGLPSSMASSGSTAICGLLEAPGVPTALEPMSRANAEESRSRENRAAAGLPAFGVAGAALGLGSVMGRR
jgi:hypothetical protein